jgi:hypothetical protein
VDFDGNRDATERDDLLQVIDADERQLQVDLFGVGAEFDSAFITLAGVEHGIDAVAAGSTQDGADVFRTFGIVEADARITGVVLDGLFSRDGFNAHGRS